MSFIRFDRFQHELMDFFHVSSRSSPFKDLRQGRQGSFSGVPKSDADPNNASIVREILQIHSTFAFIDFPQKGGVISFTLPETNSARPKTKWMLGRWSFPTLRRFFCLFLQGTLGLYTWIPFKKTTIHVVKYTIDGWVCSKKSPTGPTERTPKPENLIALATSLGVRW